MEEIISCYQIQVKFCYKVGNEISNGEIYDSGIIDFTWSSNLDQIFAVNQQILPIRDNKVQKGLKVSKLISSIHTFEIYTRLYLDMKMDQFLWWIKIWRVK